MKRTICAFATAIAGSSALLARKRRPRCGSPGAPAPCRRPPRPSRSPPRWAGTRRPASRSNWCRCRARPIASKPSPPRTCNTACPRSSRWRSSGRRASRSKTSTPPIRRNIYGIAVPEDSPIKTFADLKGKKIGVTSMASAGVIVARALAANNGFNPDKDVLDRGRRRGGADRRAAALASGRRALAVRHAIRADRECRRQAAHARHQGDRASSRPTASSRWRNGSRTIAPKRSRSRRVTPRARCSRSPIPKPRSASCGRSIPQTKATGKDEATALRDDIKTLEARAQSWRLESVGAKKWGENSSRTTTPMWTSSSRTAC